MPDVQNSYSAKREKRGVHLKGGASKGMLEIEMVGHFEAGKVYFKSIRAAHDR